MEGKSRGYNESRGTENVKSIILMRRACLRIAHACLRASRARLRVPRAWSESDEDVRARLPAVPPVRPAVEIVRRSTLNGMPGPRACCAKQLGEGEYWPLTARVSVQRCRDRGDMRKMGATWGSTLAMRRKSTCVTWRRSTFSARGNGRQRQETRLTDLLNGMERVEPFERIDDVSSSCFAAFGVLGHSSS